MNMSNAGLAANKGRVRIHPAVTAPSGLAGSAMLRAALLTLLAIAAVWNLRLPVTQLDDAFISYRYAHNLVAGHGLVFNPGEYVEGYTNLLWTLLIALGMKAGFEGEWLGHWLSVVFAVVSLLGTYGFAASLMPKPARLLAILAPVALLGTNAFVAWMTAGLETPLVLAATVLACWAAVCGHRYLTAFLCVAAILTRPEGALLALVLVGGDGARAVLNLKRFRFGDGLSALGPCLVVAASLAGLEAFRLFYYGDLLPNTFYAKVGGIPVSHGITYLRNFLWDGPMFLLPGLIAAAFYVKAFRPAFLFTAVTFAYVVAIGGDVFPVGRFCLPILPLMLGGTLAVAARLWPRRRAASAGLAASVLACTVFSLYGPLQPPLGGPDYDFPYQTKAAFPHSLKRQAARVHWIFAANEDESVHHQLSQIRRLVPKPKLIALIGIGKLGYWGQEFTILDMVGLCDAHIARSTKAFPGAAIGPGHSRTDSAYVLSRHPDAIQLPPNEKFTLVPKLPVYLDFRANPDLPRQYHYDRMADMWIRNDDPK